MGAYHAVASHFPIGVLIVTTLMILFRAVSSSHYALAVDRVLPAALLIGLVGGLLTFMIGLSIWNWEAVARSPMARNHVMMSAWALAVYAVLYVVRYVNGHGVWDGFGRWFMAFGAIVAATILSIAGTTGGYLAGNSTHLSVILNELGWNLYDTYYLPSWAVLVLGGLGVVIAAIAFLGRQRAA